MSRKRVWRLELAAVVLALAGIGLAWLLGSQVTIELPVVISVGIVAAFAGLVGLLIREEYRVARSDDMSPPRAFLRGLRKTIDALVMGD